jgi:hypothetical protein
VVKVAVANMKRGESYSAALRIYQIFLVFIFTSFLAPFIFENYAAPQLREELFTQYPELDELLKYEPLIVVSPLTMFSNSTIFITASLQLYTIYLPIVFTGGLTIYLILIFRASQTKNFLSPQTYNNYLIVVRAQTVQIISATLLMMIPFSMQFVAFSLKNKVGNLVSVIAYFFPFYHLFFEMLALLYFVKPYKVYLKKKLCLVYGKIWPSE